MVGTNEYFYYHLFTNCKNFFLALNYISNLMPVEVIDTQKYDQAEERKRLKKKTIEKEKNMETTHEAKKKQQSKERK